MSVSIFDLDEATFCVDGHDLGMTERTGSYILVDRPNGVSIIETGPSLSVPYIKSALSKKKIALDEVKYIIVTHIHLDHAGGAGLLLKDCPNAKVVVHPKGSRHLQNPARLIQGARAVYGDAFDSLFEPVLPIPQDRLIEMDNETVLQLSAERTLTFYHTPGHANHHFSIFDSRTDTLFAGDTLGVRYPQLERRGIYFYLPSTSPNQFNPSLMLESAVIAELLNPSRIAFGHFNVSNKTEEVYKQLRKWLPFFIKTGKSVLNMKEDWQLLKELLLAEVQKELSSYDICKDDPIYEVIQLDLTISAMGVMDYLKKQ